MSHRIVNIETYKSHSIIQFSGTLRNEKRFELLQNVFIQSNNVMHQCKIMGIELSNGDNPDYIYKIDIPEALVYHEVDERFIQEGQKNRVSLKCDSIFSTIEEAKESAMKLLDHHYELNKNNVNQFFDQYLKNNQE